MKIKNIFCLFVTIIICYSSNLFAMEFKQELEAKFNRDVIQRLFADVFKEGNIEAIGKLCQQHTNRILFFRNPNAGRATLLHTAVFCGDLELFKFLKRSKIINTEKVEKDFVILLSKETDDFGATPLQLLILTVEDLDDIFTHNKVQMFRSLLEQEENLSVQELDDMLKASVNRQIKSVLSQKVLKLKAGDIYKKR